MMKDHYVKFFPCAHHSWLQEYKNILTHFSNVIICPTLVCKINTFINVFTSIYLEKLIIQCMALRKHTSVFEYSYNLEKINIHSCKSNLKTNIILFSKQRPASAKINFHSSSTG